MTTFCHRHGTWHPAGECDRIDGLRARLAPRFDGQLSLADEAALRVAEHTGNDDHLTDRQRTLL